MLHRATSNLVGGWLGLLLLTTSTFAAAQTLRPSAAAAVKEMEAAAGAPLTVAVSPTSGLATFITATKGPGVSLRVPASASAEEKALEFVKSYGSAFGIAEERQVAVTRVSRRDDVGMEHVRLRQMHQGVPVTAGELMVHLRGTDVVAANGETLAGLGEVSTKALVGAAQATEIVRQRLEKYRGVTDAALSTPRLEILNRGLLEDGSFPTRLAWYVEARRIDLRERLWIDARTGSVLLQFSQLTDFRLRLVYDALYDSGLPGALARTEGDPPVGDDDIDAAYDYSGDTYDYFSSTHGRDSYDDAGALLVSTTRYCPSPDECPYLNASWNGAQMVYGEGYPLADDVVAHELTHAVTEHTANLFYYMQSGALNESYSDIFGETVDLTNSGGTDTAAVRWLIGEDLPGAGAFRDMWEPNNFDHPEKTDDVFFVCDDPGGDQGGVHSNSGVPNHAYALMVDGGIFNGYSVTGIGLTKAAKVQYRALSAYLLSGSGFADNYYALHQACQDLIGTAGITNADCVEISLALKAVKMRDPWPCSAAQQSVPAPCPFAKVPVDAYFDDFESPPVDWFFGTLAGFPAWEWISDFAASGLMSLWGYDPDSVNDAFIRHSDVLVPANAYAHFRHSFGFENDGSTYYDGGVIEYSINGGGSWNDAGALIVAGATYSGALSGCCGNPLAGRSAFGGDSHGYTATKLDLSSLAGQNVRFRFRIGSDSSTGDEGWYLDDYRIYQCASEEIFSDGFESGNTSAWASSTQ